MADLKINQNQAKTGDMGQTLLVSGDSIALRLWQSEQPGEDKPKASREYETVGYVLAGKAELVLDDKTIALSPGDSWVVPQGAAHTYRIVEAFTAVEATHPPARET